MVTPVESFQDSNGLWVVQTLNRDKDGALWVRLLVIHEEGIVTYKNSLVGTLETMPFEHQTFSVQMDLPTDAKKEKFNFEKHVRIDDQHLSQPELDKKKGNIKNAKKALYRVRLTRVSLIR